VRSFPTFTSDLRALADWLSEVGIKTVAMESTGVYWIPVYEILAARGFEVLLVNARDAKNVPGRKPDARLTSTTRSGCNSFTSTDSCAPAFGRAKCWFA